MIRPLTITVQNNTTLNFDESNSLTHGEWNNSPSSPLNAGASNTWTADENWGTGAQGTVTYLSTDGTVQYIITFNHPMGAAQTSVITTVNNGDYTSALTNNNLQHHDASCTISFSQIS